MIQAGFNEEIHRSLRRGVPPAGFLVAFAHILFIGADLGFPGIHFPDFVKYRLAVTTFVLALTLLSMSRWAKNHPWVTKGLGLLIIGVCGFSISILTKMTGGSESPYWTMLMLTFFGATMLLRFSVREAAALYLIIIMFHTSNMILFAHDNMSSPEFYTSTLGLLLACVVSVTGNWYIRNLQLREFTSRAELAEANAKLMQSVTELQYKRQQAELRHLQSKLNLANDLHDTVGAQLSQIAVLAERERIDNTRHLKALAVAVLENVRNFAHILKGEERVATLSVQLSQIAKGLRALGRYDVQLHLPEEDSRLPDVALLNIDRILSECTANAIRHAHASAFSLGARVKRDQLLIWFYQNATPFRWRGEAERGGLKSIGLRAQNIGALVSVRPNKGGAIFLLRLRFLRKPETVE